MFDAVIFDMDGLMVDTETAWDRCKRATCARLGLPFSDDFGTLTRGMSGDTFARCVEEHFASLGYPGVDGWAVLEEVWGRTDRAFEEGGIQKKPGLDAILEWLGQQGVPCAVASGSRIAQVRHHLGLLGLDGKFAVAVSGFDVEHAKPAPDVFLKAARELGTEPARTVVLEDSVNGIRAAHAGGFIPIMVPDRDTPDAVEGLYRHVCADLFEACDLLASGTV